MRPVLISNRVFSFPSEKQRRALLSGAVGGNMFASNITVTTSFLFQGKSQSVRDLYELLFQELNKIGPVREIEKAISVSFENRRVFASALIRNRSIKLVLRNNYKIASPRIHSVQHVAGKFYDHTILLESKADINPELMGWLEQAYYAGK
jgi:hypothetical protein